MCAMEQVAVCCSLPNSLEYLECLELRKVTPGPWLAMLAFYVYVGSILFVYFACRINYYVGRWWRLCVLYVN